MNRPTFIFVLIALLSLAYAAHVTQPKADLNVAMRQGDEEYDEFMGGGEEEFPEFDQQFDEAAYEEDILHDTAPKKPAAKPEAPAPKPKLESTKVTKSVSSGGSKPESCACKKGPKNSKSKCYYYTDEQQRYCTARECEASYICAKGGSTTCIRKKNTKKVVHVSGNTCKTVPINEYAYAPYST